MNSAQRLCDDYYRIEKAIKFLSFHHTDHPDLKEIADHMGMSEYHFQRLFTRWVGISPKKYIQYLTINSIKKIMSESKSLFATTIDGGLSSTSRLHELFVKFEGMTPGEYRRKAKGINIFFDLYGSPFGEFLIGTTERGICTLSFVIDHNREDCIDKFIRSWSHSTIRKSRSETQNYSEKIIADFVSLRAVESNLFLMGTPFQIKVWEALLRIPAGRLFSYKDVSLMIGMPRSSRAVANAIAHNPIAFIIPCHRVVRGSGHLGGYRWGLERKQALLAWESAKIHEDNE